MFASAFGVIPVAEHIQQQVLEIYEDDLFDYDSCCLDFWVNQNFVKVNSAD